MQQRRQIFQTMFQTIRDSKDSVTAVLEDALRSVDKKIEDLQEDIVDKLEKKVKREERGKFASSTSLFAADLPGFPSSSTRTPAWTSTMWWPSAWRTRSWTRARWTSRWSGIFLILNLAASFY